MGPNIPIIITSSEISKYMFKSHKSMDFIVCTQVNFIQCDVDTIKAHVVKVNQLLTWSADILQSTFVSRFINWWYQLIGWYRKTHIFSDYLTHELLSNMIERHNNATS